MCFHMLSCGITSCYLFSCIFSHVFQCEYTCPHLVHKHNKWDIHDFHADRAMCWRERGEYLKQKQMPAQRLDGHGWSSVLIIVSKYISSSSFLISKREYWIRFQTYFCFLTCSARTLNWRGQEHAQESHATSRRCSFLPNFFCPLTFEGPAVRSPLFTKTNPTKSNTSSQSQKKRTNNIHMHHCVRWEEKTSKSIKLRFSSKLCTSMRVV